jgi:hypothetical protein
VFRLPVICAGAAQFACIDQHGGKRVILRNAAINWLAALQRRIVVKIHAGDGRGHGCVDCTASFALFGYGNARPPAVNQAIAQPRKLSAASFAVFR